MQLVAVGGSWWQLAEVGEQGESLVVSEANSNVREAAWEMHGGCMQAA